MHYICAILNRSSEQTVILNRWKYFRQELFHLKKTGPQLFKKFLFHRIDVKTHAPKYNHYSKESMFYVLYWQERLEYYEDRDMNMLELLI